MLPIDTTLRGCRCAVYGCRTNGIAYHKVGGLYFCYKHYRYIRNKTVAIEHELNDATIDGEIAETIAERLEERVGL